MMASRKRHVYRLGRDTAIFLFGIAGIINEAVFKEQPREILVYFFGGCIFGIPFLRAGDKEKDKKPKDAE